MVSEYTGFVLICEMLSRIRLERTNISRGVNKWGKVTKEGRPKMSSGGNEESSLAGGRGFWNVSSIKSQVINFIRQQFAFWGPVLQYGMTGTWHLWSIRNSLVLSFNHEIRLHLYRQLSTSSGLLWMWPYWTTNRSSDVLKSQTEPQFLNSPHI